MMTSEAVFRLIAFLVLASALSVSAYFRSKAERQGGRMRSAEGKRLVAILRLLALIATLPLLGYLIQPDWIKWARFSLPDWVRWLAALVAVSTIPVFCWIFISIGAGISAKHTTRVGHRLVTHGPYRWVRHPLYSTGFILAVALTFLAAMWWLAVAAILPFAILLIRTTKEEARLVETFGDEYREYMKRTGRFVPKLGP